MERFIEVHSYLKYHKFLVDSHSFESFYLTSGVAVSRPSSPNKVVASGEAFSSSKKVVSEINFKL